MTRDPDAFDPFLRAIMRRAVAGARGATDDACLVDPADVALARDIHQIGALIGDCPGTVAMRETNAACRDADRATLLAVADLAFRQRLEWVVLGGLPQAELLYADAARRASGPIDLLVPPGATFAAQAAFRRAGWQAAIIVPANARALDRAGLRADTVRLVIEPGTGQRVHLHDRLFFDGGLIGASLTAPDAIHPRRSDTADDIPALGLGVPLLLDLLLRGNHRDWMRLKWLVDLDCALRRTTPRDHAELRTTIAALGIAPLAVAAFATLRDATGAPLPDAIETWTATRTDSDEARYRQRLIREALAAAPPPRDNSGDVIRPLSTAVRARHRLKHHGAYRAARAVYATVRSAVSAWRTPGGQHQRHPATRLDRYPVAFGFAADRLGAEAPLAILSFGCSTGEEVFTLRRYFGRARIKGIEVDPGRIAICQTRLAETADPNITFACADSAAAEPADQYHAIFAMAVFRNSRLDPPDVAYVSGRLDFARFEASVAGLVRALRPGGLIFVGSSNFRVADTRVADQLEAVFHADPARSGIVPGLFDRAGNRLRGVEDNALAFRKRATPGVDSATRSA